MLMAMIRTFGLLFLCQSIEEFSQNDRFCKSDRLYFYFRVKKLCSVLHCSPLGFSEVHVVYTVYIYIY